MCSSVKVTELPKETDELLRRLFKGHEEGFLQFGEARQIMPSSYRPHADAMRAMTLRPDDVWVSSYPRCGSTLTQELVWLLNNDLDYKKAAEVNLNQRYVFIEMFSIAHEQLPQIVASGLPRAYIDSIKTPGYLFAERVPSPRFLKSHLALSLLPPAVLDSSKMVYVARDPRDVAVSFYYLNRALKIHDFVGDFKTYWDLFHKNLILWTPIWAHVKEAWAQRHHPNMLFMFYEEIILDLPAAVRKVSTFFGKEYSDDQIKTLCDHLDFKNFKNNKSVNNDSEDIQAQAFFNQNSEAFIRKGKVGDWRAHFDEEMTRQAQEWMQHHLSDTDLRFPQA